MSVRVGNRSITNLLRGDGPRVLYRQVPQAAGTNPYIVSTLPSLTLPDNMKAMQAASRNGYTTGYARAGTGTLGVLGAAAGVAPTAAQVCTTPTGDLVFNATSAWTEVDVYLVTFPYAVVEATYAVTPGTGVVNGLPAGLLCIFEAEVLAGGVTGKAIVLDPAATAPVTRRACMTLGKTGVFFCIADAATSVRLKLAVVPGAYL